MFISWFSCIEHVCLFDSDLLVCLLFYLIYLFIFVSSACLFCTIDLLAYLTNFVLFILLACLVHFLFV